MSYKKNICIIDYANETFDIKIFLYMYIRYTCWQLRIIQHLNKIITFTLIKFSPHSFATADANIVFPQPQNKVFRMLFILLYRT